MKLCIKCNLLKQEADFYQRSDRKTKQNACKACEKARVSAFRKALKTKAIAYLGGSCQICGYNKCIDALVFHHRDATSKSFTISKWLTLSFEKIQQELNKCDLLCANCHAEIHSFPGSVG